MRVRDIKKKLKKLEKDERIFTEEEYNEKVNEIIDDALDVCKELKREFEKLLEE